MEHDSRIPHAGSIRAIAALGEDIRRRLYDFARNERRPVSRDEAASAVGISRKLAAFHLDKLVDVGLLHFRFLEPAQARVGRPPKVYAPADTSFTVSIPARRPELLADILARAVLADDEPASVRATAVEVARRRGVAAMTPPPRPRGRRIGADRALRLTEEMLVEYGFEPYRDQPRCIRLRNCPFHPLARDMPELVCQLNHAFLTGALDALGSDAVEAVLSPTAGECCVELRPTR
ncbi:helix-turn-helix transcriptional regulator [Mycolicibacterium litorale]|uniref:Transcriptional regulator n=1 Tax=Mycolicibacterium litorale TaxID=758802 RepID=A0AAD1IN71_9MYCO|nr:transcriptional regulator [Mycolicibacterium litorale]MCV7416633.1 transcriptional regulator [Mycolicibacterium litorale]TDY09886.1 putative ArsR family transcriptional regulator [Mycolicibacterium litorale]BBY17846.1 transcriptional regulator [Mycolicibacterium litorale]